jgi:hypothetical protein
LRQLLDPESCQFFRRRFRPLEQALVGVDEADFLTLGPPLRPSFFEALKKGDLHQRILVQLRHAACFVALAFQVRLRQHLQLLQRTHDQGLLQRGRQGVCIYFSACRKK